MPIKKKQFTKTVRVPVQESELKQPYMKGELSRKTIIVNNFLGGIAWGLGATVGVSIILALLGLIVHYIDFIPGIGNFITTITKLLSPHVTGN